MFARSVRAVAAAVLVGVAVGATGGLVGPGVAAAAGKPTTSNGITRIPLGEATPTNAPGQVLYLQRVIIAPGARLAEHFHQGTQVATVTKGTLTYNIVVGTVTITDADGTTRDVVGPKVVRVRAGQSLVERAGLTHYGANTTSRRVVIELAALLEQGAPLSTVTGTSATGTALQLTVNLESQDRVLRTGGASGNAVYGWNRLTGTANVQGQSVGVELLGSVAYRDGNGPFGGFVTLTFADGATLGLQIQGTTTAGPNGSAAFAATLGVITGTGRYATATGTGTFVGSRTTAIGAAVASTIELRIGP